MNMVTLIAVGLAGWIDHLERHHQGLGNKTIEPGFGSVEEGGVGCRGRLGGLPRYDYRDAA